MCRRGASDQRATRSAALPGTPRRLLAAERGAAGRRGACRPLRRAASAPPARLTPRGRVREGSPLLRSWTHRRRARLARRIAARAAAPRTRTTPAREPSARIRALVDREAGMLDAAARAELAPAGRGAVVRPRAARAAARRPRGRRGDGQRCRAACGWSATAAWRRRSVRVRDRRRAAPRDRADPRAARPPGRRGRAALRRAAARRVAGQRRHPAARARRPVADDPPLPPARAVAGRPRRVRLVVGAAARPAARRGAARG